MKKFQLLSCILGIAVLFSSCVSQHRLQLVGHYKPNTEVAKNKDVPPASPSEEMMKPLISQNENTLVASINETTPQLKSIYPALKPFFEHTTITPKQAKKLDKKLEQLKVKLEKQTQGGKQIQQSNLLSNQHKHQFLSSDDQILYIVVAILLPPLAVYLYEDKITNHFWIDLLLTILIWVPGIIYALIIILGGVHD